MIQTKNQYLISTFKKLRKLITRFKFSFSKVLTSIIKKKFWFSVLIFKQIRSFVSIFESCLNNMIALFQLSFLFALNIQVEIISSVYRQSNELLINSNFFNSNFKYSNCVLNCNYYLNNGSFINEIT